MEVRAHGACSNCHKTNGAAGRLVDFNGSTVCVHCIREAMEDLEIVPKPKPPEKGLALKVNADGLIVVTRANGESITLRGDVFDVSEWDRVLDMTKEEFGDFLNLQRLLREEQIRRRLAQEMAGSVASARRAV